MSCPVVDAIKSIRGGFYSTESGFSDDSLVKIGGKERVCDDVKFYAMKRQLEFARFKLSKPDKQQCEAKYQLMFDGVIGRSYGQLYSMLADKLFKHLYEQFIILVDLIGEMEKLIANYIQIIAKLSQFRSSINVSLPDIIFLPDTDVTIMRSPDELSEIVNRIICYVNNIDINAIIKEPISVQIEKVPKYVGNRINLQDEETIAEKVSPMDDNHPIYLLEETLKHEMVVIDALLDAEKYHCGVINRMSDIIDKCKMIIESLHL